MKEWLGGFLDMSSGVPCVRTFTRIFNVLRPDHLNQALLTIARSLGEKPKREVVSFDGKTMRGTSSSET